MSYRISWERYMILGVLCLNLTAMLPVQAETIETTTRLEEAAPVEVPASTEQNVQPVPSSPVLDLEEQPLSSVFEDKAAQRQNRPDFTSPDYLLRVGGLLLFLLGGFFVVAKLWASKVAQDRNRPLTPFNNPLPQVAKSSGVLESLLARHPNPKANKPLKPKILSRTRLGPSKEIHIVKVGDRQLVIGSTGQQMTLLTELGEETETQQASATSIESNAIVSSSPSADPGQIYQKYLNRRHQQAVGVGQGPMPDEEVTLLKDFEDHWEA